MARRLMMAAEFRSTKDLTATLIRIAHKLSDENGLEEDADQILETTRQIIGRSLMASLPSDNVMSASKALIEQHFKSKYAVIGGVAMGVHGIPRGTEDIDFLVEPFPDNQLLGDREKMNEFGFDRAKSHTGTVTTIYRKNGDGMIELLAANDDLRKWSVETAEHQTILGSSVPVVSAAALVALKIHAMTQNPKRKQNDSNDVFSVLSKSNPDMTVARQFLSEEENRTLDKLMSAI